MELQTYEKDGFVLKKCENNVDGSNTVENGCQVRLMFVVHVGGGFGDDAITEDEPMFVNVVEKKDAHYRGKLCGISMNSDRIQPDMDVLFAPEHILLIKTKEMIEKEQQMFGMFVKKQKVVETERKEYYEKVEKEKKEKEEKEKEEAAKFMKEGGFFFGDMGGSGGGEQKEEEDEIVSGEKRKRDPEDLTNENEGPLKKQKLD